MYFYTLLLVGAKARRYARDDLGVGAIPVAASLEVQRGGDVFLRRITSLLPIL